MTVSGRAEIADRIIELTLVPADGRPRPTWGPGAHIDVLAGDHTRQYSLTGEPGAAELRIAVLHEPDGKGGSTWLHANAVPGARIGGR